MKRRILVLAISTCLILLTGVLCGAVEEPRNPAVPEDAVAAAQQGLRIFHDKVAADPEKWGLESSSDGERVVLGEGYRIAYIGRSVYTASNDASIIMLEDKSLYPTCVFTIDLDGKPESFVTVCRMGGGEYQFAVFGGDASNFGIARDAFRKVAGDSIAPILMQFGGQYLMVLEKDGKESVLPVPFDAATAAIVASGQGFVETSTVIESMKVSNDESVEGASGGTTLDVWNNDPRQMTDSTPCIIALAVVGGICILGYLAGVVVLHVRNRKTSRHSQSTDLS